MLTHVNVYLNIRRLDCIQDREQALGSVMSKFRLKTEDWDWKHLTELNHSGVFSEVTHCFKRGVMSCSLLLHKRMQMPSTTILAETTHHARVPSMIVNLDERLIHFSAAVSDVSCNWWYLKPLLYSYWHNVTIPWGLIKSVTSPHHFQSGLDSTCGAVFTFQLPNQLYNKRNPPICCNSVCSLSSFLPRCSKAADITTASLNLSWMQQVSWLAVSQPSNSSGRFTHADFILSVVTGSNLVHTVRRTCELLHILLSFFVWVNFNMRPVQVEVIETGFWLTDNENVTSLWHSWDKCAVKFYQTRTPPPLFPIVHMETWYPQAITSKRENLISK